MKRLQTDLKRYKTAKGFRTRRNYYYSSSQQRLLELQYINNACQQCSGYRQGGGRVEFDSLLKRRGRTLGVWSVVLEMLEDKEDCWFDELEDDSPKVKWMRGVYPHVGYTQAPLTVALGSRAKAFTLQGRHRRFVGESTFLFLLLFVELLFLLVTQQKKWNHYLQQQVQSLISHNNYIPYKACTLRIVRSTHAIPQYCNCNVCILYSSVYVSSTPLFSSKFWYCSRFR